jgi:flavin reductase (DIM6/NTAB) family NADH-FMN oxidoreductase RutF
MEDINKKEAQKKNSLQPQPKAVVSCRGKDGRENALVVGYCGNCSYDPPMLMIGIVPSRFSYSLIKESGCMVVNLPTKKFMKEFEYLGSVSGRDEDKLKKMDIATKDGDVVAAPIFVDCPVNIELKIVDSIKTGSHEMFACLVEKVHCDAKYLNEDGTIDFSKIDLI